LKLHDICHSNRLVSLTVNTMRKRGPSGRGFRALCILNSSTRRRSLARCYGEAQERARRQRGLLSLPTPRRPTPMATTGPFFTIQHDSESVMSVRMVRRYGIRASSEERSNAQYPTG
jgi:hypothetical protein